jgi:lipopolysaccharide/colanic/teichoic acid biosynthesis glycosyltransferase
VIRAPEVQGAPEGRELRERRRSTELAATQELARRYAADAHHPYERRLIDAVLRGCDVVIASGLLVASAPALGPAVALVVLTGGRPALYRGARVGRAGRVFEMYKLRTLRAGAEERLGSYQGADLDRRAEAEITRVGRVLRRFHIDELPQLYNVVRGDMSLVGPRPIRPVFFEALCVEIPQYWQRLVVRPGITGLAQLRMERGMTWSEKLAHDLEWLADRSLGLYLRLLAATAWRVLKRIAYGEAL